MPVNGTVWNLCRLYSGPTGLRDQPDSCQFPGPQALPVNPIKYPASSKASVNTGNLLGNQLPWVPADSICQMFLPVRRAAREGLHCGAATNAWLNSKPCRAILSNAGVWTKSAP